MGSAHPIVWPVSRVARRIGPDVCSVPGLGYVVSGAQFLRDVLLDSERFRKDGASSVGTVITQVFGPTALANMEGEAHAALRRGLQGLFTPKASAALLDAVTDPALRALGDRLESGQQVEWSGEAKVLASTTVQALVASGRRHGRDPVAARAVHETATRLAGLLSARVRPMRSGELARAHRLRDELVGRLGTSLERADASTVAGCLMSAGVAESDVRGVVAMIVVAGVETTSVSLARTIALCSDLGLWGRLRSNPDSIPGVVDEALRYLSPLPVCTRTVASTCEVHGRRLRGGRTLICHLYNAVRDPRVIERGDDFLLGRDMPTTLRHLWFGAGPHFCIGMPLARELLIRSVRCLAERGGVRVRSRSPARGVLIPAYSELVVERDRRRPEAA